MEFSDVSNFLRFFEAIVALFLLSWSTTRLPFLVKLACEYVHQLTLFLSSTPSVFLIGNVIIIALVAKFPSQQTGNEEEEEDSGLYEDFVGETHRKIEESPEEPEEKEIEKKTIVCTVRPVNKITDISNCPVRSSSVGPVCNGSFGPVVRERRVYGRSKSEVIVREDLKLNKRKVLRRTETEKCRKDVSSGGGEKVVEELSNDEFRRTVEEFIAKQRNFLREENMAVVPSKSG